MTPKRFQLQVLADLERYLELLNATNSVIQAYNQFWAEKNVRVGFDDIPCYQNEIVNTPRVCFKVPTGGGKTYIACNSLKVIFDNLPSRKARMVVWLVPSEAILTQTLKNLSDPTHPYHQKLEADFNGRFQVYNKQQVLDGQQFNPTTVNEQLSIVVMSFDSFRIKNKEGRKVYQENGNLQQFSKYINTPETLIKGVDETALIQVLNQLSPVIIVDESHHTTGDLSVEMLKNLNPSFILDLTATPRKNANIISYVDAAQLKTENMVKLPVIVYNRPSKEEVIADALDLRNKLEELAKVSEDKRYIRPIVLFQAQPKQAENKETFERLKQRLIDSGIPKDEIAVKTAEINELKNVKLDDPSCKIRYIITVNALKEGWDCPFAYILATLANKTSAVDVEQILGRVLRLPYTEQNESKFLNLSYVLTCSNDFHETIKKIIKGLNDAGFSEKECRVAEEKVDTLSVGTTPVQGTLPLDTSQEREEEFLQFDGDSVKDILAGRTSAGGTSSLDTMLMSAETNSDAYETTLQANNEQPLGNLPLEVRSKVPTYPIYEQFKEDALALKIPQFYIKAAPSIFSLLNPNEKSLLTKEELTDGFTLKDKDVSIDFGDAGEAVIAIDVQKDERPKYRQLSHDESEYFKTMMQSLPPEGRVRNCKLLIKRSLEKFDCISGSDLSTYLDRVIENMNSDELAAMEKNIFGYTEKIKAKIEKLLAVYCRQRFDHLLETGKIECLPSFQFKKEIAPGNTIDMLSKSLYTSEQSINGFELKVIDKIVALPTVKWWHRNMDRIEFCINGFLNHYPDFIVMMNSGKVVMVETKGGHLVTNDDSREKAELGKIWHAQAGAQYRYYMVSEEALANNPDAKSLDEFLRIMKEI